RKSSGPAWTGRQRVLDCPRSRRGRAQGGAVFPCPLHAALTEECVVRKRLWCSLLPLLFTLVCPGAPVQSRGPAGCCCGADQKDDKDNKDVANWVCPRYCWGNFGSYCGYYARNCDGTTPQYVNLNWDCGKPSNNCDTPDNTKCVPVGSYYGKGTAKKQHH